MRTFNIYNQLTAAAAFTALLSGSGASAIEAGKVVQAAPVLAASQQSDAPRRSGFLGGVFNCDSGGNKQVIGAAAGGVLGGFLGNRIAGGGSRTLGTLLGGALGAAAGSALGCKLQKNDQAKAQHALENAVSTGKDQAWQSDESGASGKVQVSQNASGASLAGIKFANGVEPASGYTKVGASYVSTAAVNLRAAPGTNSKSLGTLANGERVWVPASVTGQPWMLVSQDGIGQGYVSSALLKKAPLATASGCKMVKQTIDVPGSAAESETFQACKDKEGQWVMTRV